TGLAEVVTYLKGRQPQRVIALVANCLSLEYLAEGTLPLECPYINPNGSTRESLARLLESSQAEGVNVVLEESSYLTHKAPGTLLTSIERPNDGIDMRIYDLSGS